jgi:hypothetical protein
MTFAAGHRSRTGGQNDCGTKQNKMGFELHDLDDFELGLGWNQTSELIRRPPFFGSLLFKNHFGCPASSGYCGPLHWRHDEFPGLSASASPA